MNAEEMRSVADDDQPPQAVGAGNHGDAAGRLLGVAALGFGDDGALGNAHALQVLAAHGAFVVLVAPISAQGDEERGYAVVIERKRVVEAGAEIGTASCMG